MPERVKVVAMIYEYKTFFYSPNLNQFPMVFNCSIKKKQQPKPLLGIQILADISKKQQRLQNTKWELQNTMLSYNFER